MSSNHRMNGIYAALDSHQYTRAIKLCLAAAQQPGGTDQMVQALLAHSYAKASQRYNALVTVQKLLLPPSAAGTAAAPAPAAGGGGDELSSNAESYFPELALEIKYSLERIQGGNQQDESQQKQQQQHQSQNQGSQRRGGKKGKKRGSSSAAPPPANTAATKSGDDGDSWDWIDAVDTPPTLPENWDQLPPTDLAITDQHLLATVITTVFNILRLPLTAYQIYCWACAASPQDAILLRRTYIAGLAVIVAPQYEHLTTDILANMQVLALQLARLQQQIYGQAPATAWAALSALWQLQYAGNSNSASSAETNNDPEQERKRQLKLAMLPRLAESLASKCIEQQSMIASQQQQPQDPQEMVAQTATEDFMLYMKAFDVQEKWAEKLAAVEERIKQGEAEVAAAASRAGNGETETTVLPSPPRETLLDLKSDALLRLGRCGEAREVLEMDLIREYPDNWTYWKRHMECSLADGDGQRTDTAQLIDQVTESRENSNDAGNSSRRYPLRGPHLMRVELAAERYRRSVGSGDDSSSASVTTTANGEEILRLLVTRIREYGATFAPRAACTFNDLVPYLDLLLTNCSSVDVIEELLKWLAEFSVVPCSEDAKERRKQLRAFIFCTQAKYKVLVKCKDLQQTYMPDWSELVQVWRDFRTFDEAQSTEEAQKESRPADELVLLAVQQILYSQPDDEDMLIVACAVLEAAMLYSPYNPYIKISAVFVYGHMNAVSRCWGLYQDLQIKHIQHESCAYLILPFLQSGGFYFESINVCQEILRLQRAAIRDAAEFASRAMENGILSKAEEIVCFQRARLNKSLTTLEAKGLILDHAPMYPQEDEAPTLGARHGVIGGDEDMERVSQMVAQAHSPLAAFSLLRLAEIEAGDSDLQVSENRDFAIFNHDILIQREFEPPEQIISDSVRRGVHHSLLIRAALCVEATKGPKKGKIQKSSDVLKRRCKSLLSYVSFASRAPHSDLQPKGYGSLLLTMAGLCKAIAAVNAHPETESDKDSLERREEQTSTCLEEACRQLKMAQAALGFNGDPSVPRVSRLLSDCVVPVFALFQMCAKVLDIYGWGRRKRKTKRVAAVLADFAVAFSSMVDEMKNCVSDLPEKSAVDLPEALTNLVEESVWKDTNSNLVQSQQCTRERLRLILEGVIEVLQGFNI